MARTIKLDWSGATSTIGIEGYEIQYKLTGDTTYSPLTFVTTTNTYGSHNWDSAIVLNSYNFRIRTKQIDEQFSNFLTTTVTVTNAPPTTMTNGYFDFLVDSASLFYVGATDDLEIKGHEISYKVQSASTWTIQPFITTDEDFLFYNLTGLTQNTNYDIRIRTQDILDLWSVNYFQTSGATAQPYQYLRSDDSQTTSDMNKCLVNFPTVNCWTRKPVSILNTGDTVYTNSNTTSVFNGGSNYWRIGNTAEGFKSYRINTSGVILQVVSCTDYRITLLRSENSLDVFNYTLDDACSELSLDLINVYIKTPITYMQIGDVVYENSSMTIPFNGYYSIWLLSEGFGTYSAIISEDGVVTDIGFC